MRVLLGKALKAGKLLLANGTSNTMGGKYPTDEEVASVRNWHKCWWEAVKNFQAVEKEVQSYLATPTPSASTEGGGK